MKGSTVNRFQSLENNPDLKPEEKEEINVPEPIVQKKDQKQSKNDPKPSQPKEQDKIISFQKFIGNVIGLNYKDSFTNTYKAFMRNAENVSLPQNCNANDYAVYYSASSRQQIFEQKSVLQTECRFPMSQAGPKLEKALSQWNISEEDGAKCVGDCVRQLVQQIMEQSQQAGYGLGPRLMIQIINAKNPNILPKYLIQEIKKHEFQPQLAVDSIRYVNFVVWLAMQINVKSEHSFEAIQAITAFLLYVTLIMEKSEGYTDYKCFKAIRILEIISDFSQLLDKRFDYARQMIVSMHFILEKIEKKCQNNEFAKQAAKRVQDAIGNAIAIEPEKAFFTLTMQAKEEHVKISDETKNLLMGLTSYVTDVSEEDWVVFNKDKLKFLGDKLKTEQIQREQKRRESEQIKIADNMKKSNIILLVILGVILIASVYIATICLVFDHDSQEIFGKMGSCLISTIKSVIKYVNIVITSIGKIRDL